MSARTEQVVDARGVIGTVICCALWGGNAVAVKFALPDLPPFGCAALRFVIGLPFVALVCLRARQPLTVPRRHVGLVFLHASLTVAQIVTFNWGTNLSLAGRASVLINVHPLFVAPLAALLLHEKLGPRATIGLLVAALGVGIMLGNAYLTTQNPAQTGFTGDLIVLVSGIIFAVQTIAQKLTFPSIAPGTLLFTQSALAIPVFVGISMLVEGPSSYHFTPQAVWGVLYQGVAALGICYSLWFWLLRHYPAGRLAAIAFLSPLFGIGFSRILRAESLTLPLLLAAASVGLGIYLVASDRPKRHEGLVLAQARGLTD